MKKNYASVMGPAMAMEGKTRAENQARERKWGRLKKGDFIKIGGEWLQVIEKYNNFAVCNGEYYKKTIMKSDYEIDDSDD